ncbi:MAG: hypothetical protein KAI66_28075, partial [Lentisphaeria bacterium]|nr:hypothetical protein [Lentisphaeria bacterium]
MAAKQTTRSRILSESTQAPITRVDLLKRLGKLMERTVVVYFTSSGVIIDDGDVSIISDVLDHVKTDGRLLVVLSSAGGDILAAERVIRTLRSYSPDGEYEVLVPHKAKSAATLICMGATRIYMSKTSEFGPVDPQMLRKVGNNVYMMSVASVVESYRELLS